MKIIKLKYIITLMIISVLQVQPGTAQNRVSGTDSPAALDAATLKGGGSVAVGTFVNKSGNSAFDYLETILPNALASALESKHNITTIKPRALADVLRKKNIEKEFNDSDLFSVSSDIKADFFVFGTFEPQSGNRIKTEINIYKTGSSSLFTFTDVGFLEVEIFRLIDRLSLNIKNITDTSMYFKSENVNKNARLAVLTNIEGDELNKLYFEVLNKGHKLAFFQGLSIKNFLDTQSIEKFYHINSESASYRRIYDKKALNLLHGTWAGKDYYKDLIHQRNLHDRFTFNFTETGKKTFNAIGKIGPGGIDYLVIIGFNDSKSEAWIRCINLKTGNLVFTQSGIQGSSVNDISRKILINISGEESSL